MEMASPGETIDGNMLGGEDRARLWRIARYGDLDCLSASFTRHRYAMHTHTTWVVGVITAGCEGFTYRGSFHRLPAGSLCVVPPGEPHDGQPVSGGYSYRMIYPERALLEAVAGELGGGLGTPTFAGPALDDPELAGRFVTWHRAVGGSAPPLAADETLLGILSDLLRRHARIAIRPSRLTPPAAARALEYLRAHLAEPVELTTVAAVAGLSRFELIRQIRKATGLTPHRWQVDQRVHAARDLLRAGTPPAEVAMRTGFADQSHLNRVFLQRLGLPPGAYRRAAVRGALHA